MNREIKTWHHQSPTILLFLVVVMDLPFNNTKKTMMMVRSTKLLLLLLLLLFLVLLDNVVVMVDGVVSSSSNPNFGSSSSCSSPFRSLDDEYDDDEYGDGLPRRIPRMMTSRSLIRKVFRGGGGGSDAGLTTTTTTTTTRPSSVTQSNRLVVGMIVIVGGTAATKENDNPPSISSIDENIPTNDDDDHNDSPRLLFPWLTLPTTTPSMGRTSSSSTTSTTLSTVLFLDGHRPRVSCPLTILRISHEQNNSNNKNKKDDDDDVRDNTDVHEHQHDHTIEESLALLCDMILLVILPSSPSTFVTDQSSTYGLNGPPRSVLGPIVAALERGADQRSKVPKTSTVQQGMDDQDGTFPNRGILLLAAPGSDNTTWVQHMVQSDLADISPTQWRAMEFRTLNDLNNGMDELAQTMWTTNDDDGQSSSVLSTLFPDTGTTVIGDDDNSDPTNEEIFAGLLQAVIRSKQHGRINRDMSSTVVVSLEYPSEDETSSSGLIKERKYQEDFDHGPLSSSTPTTIESTEEISLSGSVPNSHVDVDGLIQDIMTTAQRRVQELETKMESLVLQSSLSAKGDKTSLPLLEFGTLAQDILHPTKTQLWKLKDDGIVPNAMYNALMQQVENEVVRLYKDQLQALRNYYGQRYEAMIMSSVGQQDDRDDEMTSSSSADTERQRAEAAEYTMKGFVAAAQNAVPVMYRETTKVRSGGINSIRSVDFDHVDAYRGLIQDMMEATQRLEDEQDLAEMLLEDDGDDDEGSAASTRKRRRRIPKWLERIAARVFVFGVNYFQGWLAWQGIKRAALERDRNQPKFPLF